ncbi:TPA: hypothetical protein ACH6AG_000145 [Campylobacter jejuni]
MGYNQRWYDVSSQRKSGVNYVNTTGKPILVNIVYGEGYGESNVFVDGVKILKDSDSYGVDVSGTFTFIVPPNSTYKMTASEPIELWAELR